MILKCNCGNVMAVYGAEGDRIRMDCQACGRGLSFRYSSKVSFGVACRDEALDGEVTGPEQWWAVEYAGSCRQVLESLVGLSVHGAYYDRPKRPVSVFCVQRLLCS